MLPCEPDRAGHNVVQKLVFTDHIRLAGRSLLTLHLRLPPRDERKGKKLMKRRIASARGYLIVMGIDTLSEKISPEVCFGYGRLTLHRRSSVFYTRDPLSQTQTHLSELVPRLTLFISYTRERVKHSTYVPLGKQGFSGSRSNRTNGAKRSRE